MITKLDLDGFNKAEDEMLYGNILFGVCLIRVNFGSLTSMHRQTGFLSEKARFENDC